VTVGTQAEFEGVSEIYDDTLPAHVVQHYVERRVSVFRSVFPGGARLIDVGCGTGRLAAALGEAGYIMSGIDRSPGMLKHALGRGVSAVCAGVDRLPFGDSTFDGAISVAVMHHLKTPDLVRACIREMLRITRPQGTIVIWDHNPLNPYWPLLMRRLPQDRGDERLVGSRELASGVTEGGGRVVSEKRLGFMPDFAPPASMALMTRAEAVLERLPGVRLLAAHNVVLARKVS
jgi:SAM-dependent methyltransferase